MPYEKGEEMQEESRPSGLRLERIEREYRGLLQDLRDLATALTKEEYRIQLNLDQLPDQEQERYRQYPEGFLRNYLLENGFPHPINGIAVVNAEACLAARAQPTVSHELYPNHSTIVVQ